MESSNRVFVFGSNLAGRHGAGSALKALRHHGAKLGHGVGYHGNSYAIPTKTSTFQVLSLDQIGRYVDSFIEFAKARPELEFDVVKIGCGLAGYSEEQMAPLFSKAPDNVILPEGWRS